MYQGCGWYNLLVAKRVEGTCVSGRGLSSLLLPSHYLLSRLLAVSPSPHAEVALAPVAHRLLDFPNVDGFGPRRKAHHAPYLVAI